jgi:hypothetical protein
MRSLLLSQQMVAKLRVNTPKVGLAGKG